MPAYAYLRKSSVHDASREVSPAMQEAAVRDLATRHGDEDLVILSDMNVSGRKGRAQRPGYDALLTAIEDGTCRALYSYSLSRLGRSVPELARLIADCGARKIPVRLSVDAMDTSTASGRMMAHVLMSVAQFESDVASERVLEANAIKRSNGGTVSSQHFYGERPGEDLRAVLDAYAEARSYVGAARLLNAKGIRPKNKATKGWWGSVVKDLVERHAPSDDDQAPKVARPWRESRRFRLARLLACGVCGHVLTGGHYRAGKVRYVCSAGKSLGGHTRISITEDKILDAVITEARRVQRYVKEHVVLDADGKPTIDAGKVTRADLDRRRARVLDLYESEDIDKAEKDRRLIRIADQEAALDVRRSLRIYLDWNLETGDPAKVNSYLRKLFTSITVDPASFVPKVYEWRDPGLRGRS